MKVMASAPKSKWGALAMAGLSLLLATSQEAPIEASTEDPIVQSIEGLTTYPRLAQLSGVQGTVRLTVRVKEDGAVESVRRVAGPGILSHDAERTLMKWKFSKCNSNCGIREVDITFHFVLEGECSLPECQTCFRVDLPSTITVKAQKARAIIN